MNTAIAAEAAAVAPKGTATMRYQAYIVCFTTDTADICMEPRASRRAAVADAETLFAQYGGDYRAVVVDLEQRANGWREEAVIYSIAAGEEIDEAPAAAPRCATCAGEGDCPDCGTLEAAEPTPGAWHIIEVRPAGDEPSTCGGLWFRADEGHMGVYSVSAAETALHIYSSTEHMDNLWGSGEGGHIATIPMMHSAQGRCQALANAQAIVNAHNAA